MSHRIATSSLLLVAAVALAAPRGASAQELDVPYVPTPTEVVSTMLELTEPTPRDSLYDLGSGDGRIVITAAERYDTPGIGVELDSGRVATARQKARESGVQDMVRFIRGDLFDVDVSNASVVTLYLLPSVNRRLRPKLLRQLEPGSRVVSHDFDMGAWQADSIVRVPEENGGRATVYFWKVPAHVAGTWVVTRPDGSEARIRIDQKYQELRMSLPDGSTDVGGASLDGAAISFVLGTSTYTGTVTGDGIQGTTDDGGSWSARRVSGGAESIENWQRSSGYREGG